MAQSSPFSTSLLCPWRSRKIRSKRSSNLLNRPQHSRLGPSKHASSRKSCVLSTVIWLESPRVLNTALEIPASLIRKGFPLSDARPLQPVTGSGSEPTAWDEGVHIRFPGSEQAQGGNRQEILKQLTRHFSSHQPSGASESGPV